MNQQRQDQIHTNQMNRVKNSFDVITNMVDTLAKNLHSDIRTLIYTRCNALLQKIAPEPQQTLNYISPSKSPDRKRGRQNGNPAASFSSNNSIEEDSSISLQQAIDLGSRYTSYEDYEKATTKQNGPLLLFLTDAEKAQIWNPVLFTTPTKSRFSQNTRPVPQSLRKAPKQRTRKRR